MATSDVGRWLTSRKNIAGMTGAVAGVGLHLAGLIGDVWPVVAAGLYAVGALVGPSDPRAVDESLTDALRAEGAELRALARQRRNDLPHGVVPAIERILDVLKLVLDRLDQVADRPADQVAAPDRLAAAAEILREDLPTCLDTYLGRAPTTPPAKAAAELVTQIDLVAGAVDRLAAAVPDVHAQRAEELTEELRRRHGTPPTP